MMAGSITLLHEAVRLEANREHFKALTKYLGALAAVSHALLEICENGSDALYTSIFEEKMGIVNRCYDRVNTLYTELTKPDPPVVTTIASAGVIPNSKRNSCRSSIDTISSQFSVFSNTPLYENIPANGNCPIYTDEQEENENGRRARRYRTLPSPAKESEYYDYQKPTAPVKPVEPLRFRKFSTMTSVGSVESVPSTPTGTLRPISDITPSSNLPKLPLVESLTGSLRASRAKYGPGSNFGTILSSLSAHQHSSVFYGLPGATSQQDLYDGRSPYQTLGGEYDSDIEAERELPNLQDIMGIDTVRHLNDKERRRQQAIIELFHIERNHVGRLKVMYRVFYKPLMQNQLLSKNFLDLLPLNMLQLLFGNIEEILQVHMAINRAMKSILRERRLVAGVGDLMMSFLDGPNGDHLRNASIAFCQYQQYALDMLKVKRKEDKKFSLFLEKAENNPMCRGFPLRDLLPGEMKHLSRYPLLLENVLKYTPEHWDETWKLRHCVKCAKDILHAVNSAKRNFDNARKLAEIREKMDLNQFYMTDHPIVSAYPNFDLTKYNLIFDGGLKWRIGKKTVDVHAVVLDHILILLTISDYDRYRLMFYELRVSGANGRIKKMGPVKFSPLLELAKVSTRTCSTDERAFYLISKAPPYAFTYELVAPSIHERRTWTKMISDQIDRCKHETRSFSPKSRKKTLTSEDTYAEDGRCSSVETGPTFSSDNESNENLYEQIDTGNSDEDSEVFSNADTANGPIYDPVPPSSSEQNSSPVPYAPARMVGDYDLPPMDMNIADNAAFMGLLTECERNIVQEMRKRRELLARIFDLSDDDFSNIADLIASFNGPKSMTECLLAAMEEVNQLLSLVYWNNTSSTSSHHPLDSTGFNGGYEEPSTLRKRQSLSSYHTNWIQHCLAPRLTPSLLSLMRYMSNMLQLVNSGDTCESDSVRMKL